MHLVLFPFCCVNPFTAGQKIRAVICCWSALLLDVNDAAAAAAAASLRNSARRCDMTSRGLPYKTLTQSSGLTDDCLCAKE
jgi:hypothetical protein